MFKISCKKGCQTPELYHLFIDCYQLPLDFQFDSTIIEWKLSYCRFIHINRFYRIIMWLISYIVPTFWRCTSEIRAKVDGVYWCNWFIILSLIIPILLPILQLICFIPKLPTLSIPIFPSYLGYPYKHFLLHTTDKCIKIWVARAKIPLDSSVPLSDNLLFTLYSYYVYNQVLGSLHLRQTRCVNLDSHTTRHLSSPFKNFPKQACLLTGFFLQYFLISLLEI